MNMACKPKRKKDFPCIRCDIHVKVNDKAIQCAMCDLWVHQKCEKMSDETFKVLDIQHEETGQCFWSCKSCCSYARKFDKRMRDVEKRVQGLETLVPSIQSDLVTVKEEVATLKKVTTEISEENSSKSDVNQEKVTATVLEEMRERESRKCNLIIHNLAEPDNNVTDTKERIEKDKSKVQQLCKVIGVEVDVLEGARFAKQLGASDDSTNSPRPLLIDMI